MCSSVLRTATGALRRCGSHRKGDELWRWRDPLWAQAQGKVLRELGTQAWADAQRHLAHVLHVALKKQGRRPG